MRKRIIYKGLKFPNWLSEDQYKTLYEWCHSNLNTPMLYVRYPSTGQLASIKFRFTSNGWFYWQSNTANNPERSDSLTGISKRMYDDYFKYDFEAVWNHLNK